MVSHPPPKPWSGCAFLLHNSIPRYPLASLSDQQLRCGIVAFNVVGHDQIAFIFREQGSRAVIFVAVEKSPTEAFVFPRLQGDIRERSVSAVGIVFYSTTQGVEEFVGLRGY